MAFDIDNLAGSLGLGNIKGEVYDIAYWIIWGLVIMGVLIFAYMKYQDKKIYKYPVRVLRQRNNGQVKETNTFGGYIKGKGGVTQFLIKQGRFKKKAMDKLPLSQFMDEDERIYYYQISPDAPLIQVKRDFTIEQVLVANEYFVEPSLDEKEELIKRYIEKIKTYEEYKGKADDELKVFARDLLEQDIDLERTKQLDVTKLKYSPVPTDQKQSALLEIANLRNTLGVDTNKQFAYFVIGVIALIVLGTVIFYIAVNKGDIPLLTKMVLPFII